MLGADLHMKKQKQLSTAEVLEYLRKFTYDKVSGKIINNKGRAIGSRDRYGYLVYNLLGKQFKVHRLVWLLETGDWPVGILDHKDGVKDNNRFSNLRDTTQKVNCNNPNNTLRSDNKSGIKGISWDSNRGKWCARIQKEGKYKFMGYFNNKNEAIRVLTC